MTSLHPSVHSWGKMRRCLGNKILNWQSDCDKRPLAPRRSIRNAKGLSVALRLLLSNCICDFINQQTDNKVNPHLALMKQRLSGRSHRLTEEGGGERLFVIFIADRPLASSWSLGWERLVLIYCRGHSDLCREKWIWMLCCVETYTADVLLNDKVHLYDSIIINNIINCGFIFIV